MKNRPILTLANCGSFWLPVDIDKKIASGDINSEDYKFQTINMSNLKSELKKATNK